MRRDSRSRVAYDMCSGAKLPVSSGTKMKASSALRSAVRDRTSSVKVRKLLNVVP